MLPKAHGVVENHGTTNTLTILESCALSRDARHGVMLSVDTPLTYALVSSVETAFFQQRHHCGVINAEDLTYTLGINEFADLTQDVVTAV